jgi:hypothetical protein
MWLYNSLRWAQQRSQNIVPFECLLHSMIRQRHARPSFPTQTIEKPYQPVAVEVAADTLLSARTNENPRQGDPRLGEY